MDLVEGEPISMFRLVTEAGYWFKRNVVLLSGVEDKAIPFPVEFETVEEFAEFAAQFLSVEWFEGNGVIYIGQSARPTLKHLDYDGANLSLGSLVDGKVVDTGQGLIGRIPDGDFRELQDIVQETGALSFGHFRLIVLTYDDDTTDAFSYDDDLALSMGIGATFFDEFSSDEVGVAVGVPLAATGVTLPVELALRYSADLRWTLQSINAGIEVDTVAHVASGRSFTFSDVNRFERPVSQQSLDGQGLVVTSSYEVRDIGLHVVLSPVRRKNGSWVVTYSIQDSFGDPAVSREVSVEGFAELLGNERTILAKLRRQSERQGGSRPGWLSWWPWAQNLLASKSDGRQVRNVCVVLEAQNGAPSIRFNRSFDHQLYPTDAPRVPKFQESSVNRASPPTFDRATLVK